jgi:hypothetical protein
LWVTAQKQDYLQLGQRLDIQLDELLDFTGKLI